MRVSKKFLAHPHFFWKPLRWPKPSLWMQASIDRIKERMGDLPVYLSIDNDVLDPALPRALALRKSVVCTRVKCSSSFVAWWV